jgi:integrase/recombinase XerD
VLADVEIRKSLNVRDWQKAQNIVRSWESAEAEINGKQLPVIVPEACDKFINDTEARGLRESTLYKYRLLFRQLVEFCNSTGIRFLRERDVDRLRSFRESWPNRNISGRKKLDALRTLFRFCSDSGWVLTNPAVKLKPPKVTDPPTIPFTPEETQRILAACDHYPNELNAHRLRALVLFLRYSGLRIRNAVTLPRDKITNGKVFLYAAKTGTIVWCPAATCFICP